MDGPLLVLAGAGSGKTRVITYRIAHLINDHGLAPWNILAVTFTNKAAKEMRLRVETLLGGNPRGLWIGTFHSIASRMLRHDGGHIGVDPAFTIYDKGDQLAAIKRAMNDCNISSMEIKPNAALAEISRAKSRFEWPDDYRKNAHHNFEDTVSRIYTRYRHILQSNKALDFDDLIMETVRLLTTVKPIRETYQKRFQHILVDEYQDTNHPQYLFLQHVTQPQNNICAVGDDDQSIYRWRGADIRNIIDFENDYPNARLIRLEQNYRSTRTIIEAATHLVKSNQVRHDKTLWTENEAGEKIGVVTLPDEIAEAYWVTEDMQHLHEEKKIPYRDMALFYRVNAQSRAFEEECIKRGIPYTIVAGSAFYDRKEVKDVLAYLRLMINPSDVVSFERVVNEPKRKLGKTSIRKLVAYAEESGHAILTAAQEAQHDSRSSLPQKTAQGFRFFAEFFPRWRSKAEELSLGALLDLMLDESGYRSMLEDDHDPQSDARLENINELVAAAQFFEDEIQHESDTAVDTLSVLQTFLENVALVSEQDALKDEGDQLVMMTIHAAKGLEFPYVYLVGMEDGLFPHQRSIESHEQPQAIEEERRLCYVGITRAKERIVLTHADSRRLHGRSEWSRPSRFLDEIPPQYCETIAWRGGDSSSAFEALASRGGDPSANETFVPGDMVTHRSFGLGIVLEVKVDGSTRITVEFQNLGRKTLVQEYARLEKV